MVKRLLGTPFRIGSVWMSSDLHIGAFDFGDISAVKRLSDLAGWNQIEADWGRIIDLEPEGCLGAWQDGRLIGTTTFVTYGNALAWIGMVLVDPAFRRRGIAGSLLRSAMDVLTRRNISSVGLDATDAGRPLYSREGFVGLSPIIRWRGKLRNRAVVNPEIAGSELHPLEPNDIELLIEFDRTACGFYRGPLLRHLIREPEGRILVLPGAPFRGYVAMRPGRSAWHLGPIVSRNREDAPALLAGTARHVTLGEVIIDSAEVAGYAPVFDAAGLSPDRRLLRMTHRIPTNLLISDQTVAATGLEWG